ncbi:uncharacterized protein LOC113271883 [Papaver somniferum]|uniref:uncharacterized protein LOC113271883 n=1 Tax=Papaver somniferum TaxID=3469 RepID=UPI000E6F5AC9|nr:uncharacterized protein LOC113271883 [Papaver somniferum]
MGYRDADMTCPSYNIHGFNKTVTKPKGEITMRILLGEVEVKTTLCVVDIESPYNMLLWRPWVHAIKAAASTLHQCIRFPIPSGIGEIRGDVPNAKICHQVDVKNYEGRAKKRKDCWRKVKELRKEEEFRIYMIRAKEGKGIPSEIPEKEGEPIQEIKESTPTGEPRANFTAAEPTKEVNVGTEEEPEILKIGTKIDKEEEEEKTINILREYSDIFAWSMEEMPGIDLYPLPDIPQMVESASGNGRISLLDGYKGYNQIPLAEEDQEHTAFSHPEDYIVVRKCRLD